MKDQPTSDRRKEARVPIKFGIEYECLNSFFKDYVQNISRGGMFSRTDKPLPLGTELIFTLEIPKAGTKIELMGKVSWRVEPHEATEDRPAGMGISFLFRNEQERRQVDELVRGMMTEQWGKELTDQVLGRTQS